MSAIIQTAGKYGIAAVLALIEAANAIYDLFAAVYLDDQKFTPADWGDVATFGPKVAMSVLKAGKNAGDLGKELTDLSGAEQEEILAAAGERIEDERYLKILDGLLKVVDGIAEFKNPDNPGV